AERVRQDGALAARGGLLGEVADGGGARAAHAARVGLVEAGQEASERRLAGAVRADEPDPLPVRDAPREVAEEDLPAKRLGDRLDGDHARLIIGSPRTAGIRSQARLASRLRLALRPRDVLRLARLIIGSPRTAGPQPRDVLRLALPPALDGLWRALGHPAHFPRPAGRALGLPHVLLGPGIDLRVSALFRH